VLAVSERLQDCTFCPALHLLRCNLLFFQHILRNFSANIFQTIGIKVSSQHLVKLFHFPDDCERATLRFSVVEGSWKRTYILTELAHYSFHPLISLLIRQLSEVFLFKEQLTLNQFVFQLDLVVTPLDRLVNCGIPGN